MTKDTVVDVVIIGVAGATVVPLLCIAGMAVAGIKTSLLACGGIFAVGVGTMCVLAKYKANDSFISNLKK